MVLCVKNAMKQNQLTLHNGNGTRTLAYGAGIWAKVCSEHDPSAKTPSQEPPFLAIFHFDQKLAEHSTPHHGFSAETF